MKRPNIEELEKICANFKNEHTLEPRYLINIIDILLSYIKSLEEENKSLEEIVNMIEKLIGLAK
jgi:hypothetical protein